MLQRHQTSGKVGGLLSVWEKRSEESSSSTSSHSSSTVKKSSSSMNSHHHHSIKICIVGNPTSGKTSLALAFKEDDRDLPHTTLDEFNLKTMYQGKELTLTICDTKGSDDYDRYRTKLLYPNTNVFIICYSIVSRQQFESVKLKWLPEIRMLCPQALIILCATKTDLRDDHRYLSSSSNVTADDNQEQSSDSNSNNSQLVIDRGQVKKLMELYNHRHHHHHHTGGSGSSANRGGNIMYYNECSVYDQNVGVKDILDRAIHLSLQLADPAAGSSNSHSSSSLSSANNQSGSSAALKKKK